MTKTAILSTCCVWLALVMARSVESFPNGAPYRSCYSMRPAHSNRAEQKNSPDTDPYLISLNAVTAKPGDIVTATLSTRSSDVLIMGLLAVVRDSDDNWVTGIIPHADLQVINCFFSMVTVNDSGVTHTKRLNKKKQTFAWKVPSKAVPGSKYKVSASVVKDYNTFWMGIDAFLTVDLNAPNPPQFVPDPNQKSGKRTGADSGGEESGHASTGTESVNMAASSVLTVDTTTPKRLWTENPGPRKKPSSTTAAPADNVVSEPGVNTSTDDKGAKEDSRVAASGAEASGIPAWWSRWFRICYIAAVGAGLSLVS